MTKVRHPVTGKIADLSGDKLTRALELGATLVGPEKASTPDVGDVSTPEAIWEGVKKGATFGFGENLGGAWEGAKAVLRGEDFTPAYERERDIERAVQKKAEEQHPIASIAGSVVGSIPYALALPGPKAGATLLDMMALGAKQGAQLGAVGGLGDVEDWSLSEAAKKAALGGAGGAVFGGLAPAVVRGAAGALDAGEYAVGLADKLSRESDDIAAKLREVWGRAQSEKVGIKDVAKQAAIHYAQEQGKLADLSRIATLQGASGGTIATPETLRMVGGGYEPSPAQIADFAKRMRQPIAPGAKETLAPKAATTRTLNERAAKMMQETEDVFEETAARADETPISGTGLLERFDDAILKARQANDAPVAKQLEKIKEEVLDGMRARKDTDLTFSQLQRFKKPYYKKAKFGEMMEHGRADANAVVYNLFQDEMDAQAKSVMGPDDFAKYKAAQERYQLGKTAEAMTQKSLNRASTHGAISGLEASNLGLDPLKWGMFLAQRGVKPYQSTLRASYREWLRDQGAKRAGELTKTPEELLNEIVDIGKRIKGKATATPAEAEATALPPVEPVLTPERQMAMLRALGMSDDDIVDYLKRESNK